MKEKIIEIIGHGMEIERAELMADKILALLINYDAICEIVEDLNAGSLVLAKMGCYDLATELSDLSKRIFEML